MNLFTIDQLKFGGYLLLFTILLHFGITSLLNMEAYYWLWALIPLFVIPVLIVGWIYGKKDGESTSMANAAFKFHLITYLVSMSVPELKHLLELAASSENIMSTHITAIGWGFGILLHYIIFRITKEKTIKGISKSEIFE